MLVFKIVYIKICTNQVSIDCTQSFTNCGMSKFVTFLLIICNKIQAQRSSLLLWSLLLHLMVFIYQIGLAHLLKNGIVVMVVIWGGALQLLSLFKERQVLLALNVDGLFDLSLPSADSSKLLCPLPGQCCDSCCCLSIILLTD